MRQYSLVILLLCLTLSLRAQLVNEVTVHLGPKLEFFEMNSVYINSRNVVGAYAEVLASKRMNESFDVVLGLHKRDVTYFFDVPIDDPVTMQNELYFSRGVQSLFTSYQWSAALQYNYLLNPRTKVYGQFGLQFNAGRQMSIEGSRELIETSADETSYLKLVAYKSDWGAGNFSLKSGVGVYRQILDYLSLDASLTGYWSGLNHFEMSFVVEDGLGTTREEAQLYYNGLGLTLGLGVRFHLQ